MVFEHLFTTTLIGVGLPVAGFFFSMSGRSENAVDKFQTVFANGGSDLMLLALALALIANVTLLAIRNINYVVSVELDDLDKTVVLGVRKLRVSTLSEFRIPYGQFAYADYHTLKIPGMNGYRGYSFKNGGDIMGYFLVDHFTWDDQTRNVRSFLTELARRVGH